MRFVAEQRDGLEGTRRTRLESARQTWPKRLDVWLGHDSPKTGRLQVSNQTNRDFEVLCGEQLARESHRYIDARNRACTCRPKAKHGPIWKAIAARLGARPEACDRDHDTVIQPGNWRATCDGCGHVFERYKRPTALSGYRCRCRKGNVLKFEYVGDPSKKPDLTEENRLVWEAICSGCRTVHQRLRKPKRGVWRCRCSSQCELKWVYREPSAIE